jgi:leader peptidase (prepilin peptidase)/N-methyltransferase
MDILNFFLVHPNFYLLAIAALSLLIGSFLNVVIYRLPQMMKEQWGLECREYLGLIPQACDTIKLNLYLPLSHCPNCKKRLKPWHNIPLLSYIVLMGKCAFCEINISVRYPLVELLCCITSVYVAWRFGVTYQSAAALLFTWIVIALTFIDLDHHLLPDQLTLLLVWLGLFLSMFAIFATSKDAIIGAIVGYSVFAIIQWLFYVVTGKIGMGQGDFKFLAGLGAFLGWQQIPAIILLASLIGLIFGVTQMAIKQQFKSVPLPFGPYLAVAGWVSLMWGPQILQIYLNQFVI